MFGLLKINESLTKHMPCSPEHSYLKKKKNMNDFIEIRSVHTKVKVKSSWQPSLDFDKLLQGREDQSSHHVTRVFKLQHNPFII